MSQETGKQHVVRAWRRVVVILTGCTVTLLGVWRGLDPEVILLRAAVAALALGAMTSLAAWWLAFLIRSSR